jgi:hypothetical protein
MKHLFFKALLTSCICFLVACGKGDKAEGKAPPPATAPAPAPADPAPPPPPAPPTSALGVGMKAQMFVGEKTYDLEILALYGKLAMVKFRADQVPKGSVLESWVVADGLAPKGTPLALPPGDSCLFSAGQQVSCPFMTDRRRYSGRVTETHGKMALVRYDSDGAMVWNFCSECRIR